MQDHDPLPEVPEGGELTLDDAMRLAVGLHQRGLLEQAAEVCRRVLEVAPEHADALHFLGMAEHQAGHSERGLSLLMQCVALHPGYADAYNNLGQRFRLAIRGGSPTSR